MSITHSISHTQSLLDKAVDKLDTVVNEEAIALLTTAKQELDLIKLQSQKLKMTSSKTATKTKPKIKSGCYVFDDEKGFFCPQCFDKGDTKSPTKRMNSKIRVCPLCRTSIKTS